MATEEVKLLGLWVSPFALRVEWALKLKGVGYECIDEDIHDKSARLLESNPLYRRVPVLVHNGKAIPESFLILEYIDETWKQNPRLLPQDPFERSKARLWAKFGDEKIFESGYNALMTPPGEEREKAIKMTIEALEKLEEELKGKHFFGGDSIGFVDIALAWISYWLPVFEEVGDMKIVDKDRFPAISEWANRILNHPVIKDSLPPRDKMVSYFRESFKIVNSKPRGWIRF